MHQALEKKTEIINTHIHVLMQILATYPVTTVSVLKSLSLLRNILTYTRSSMCEERLSSISFIESNFDLIDKNNVYIDKFVQNLSRKLNFYVKK